MNEEVQNLKDKSVAFLKKYIGVFLIAIIILTFVFLAVANINFGQWLASTVMRFYNEYGDVGIYLGIFLISIFGNFTIIFPVPYTIALIVVSAVIPGINPFLTGFFGALGASIGEISAWLIGRGSKEMIGDSASIERMKEYVDKGWAPILIIIFAATPLPDDAFLIVLGIASYSIAKTLVFCFIGKFILCFLCAALPIWFANTPLGDFLFGLFGINLEAARAGVIPPSTPEDLIQSTITWSLTIVIMFALIYVDWGEVVKKVKKSVPQSDKPVVDSSSDNTNYSKGIFPRSVKKYCVAKYGFRIF